MTRRRTAKKAAETVDEAPVRHYAIVDTAGLVDNVILWDGQTQWAPPDGYRAQLIDDDCNVSAGDRLTPTGVVIPAEPAGPDPLAAAAQVVARQLDPDAADPTQAELNSALAAIAGAAIAAGIVPLSADGT